MCISWRECLDFGVGSEVRGREGLGRDWWRRQAGRQDQVFKPS